MTPQCTNAGLERRRCFWTTQPCACGSDTDACGNSCCAPGLLVGDSGTLATNQWIRGLLLNMLNTDKRRNPSSCGYRPSAINGHWSESFIHGASGLYGGAAEGYRVGTGLRYIYPGKYRVRELEALIEAELVATAQKLVMLGVADGVSAEVSYAGGNQFDASVIIYGPENAPLGRVALTGQRDEQAGFYWSC